MSVTLYRSMRIALPIRADVSAPCQDRNLVIGGAQCHGLPHVLPNVAQLLP